MVQGHVVFFFFNIIINIISVRRVHSVNLNKLNQLAVKMILCQQSFPSLKYKRRIPAKTRFKKKEARDQGHILLLLFSGAI